MNNKGLTKLSEECGELVTVCQKFIALRDQLGYDVVEHWDGTNMRIRMAEEVADVLGACRFVMEAFGLDEYAIQQRADRKYNLFLYWSNGGKKTNPTDSEMSTLIEEVYYDGNLVYEGSHEKGAKA